MEKGREAMDSGNYELAEALWSNALLEAEEFGESDERLIQTLQRLSETYIKQGKYRRAEKPARQILGTYEQLHGREHIKSGMAANTLAEIYHLQQKYGQAEPLYKMALSIKTKKLGASAPEVLKILQNYADLLQKTHREAEAENLLKCARQSQTSDKRRSRQNMKGIATAAVSEPSPPSEFELQARQPLRAHVRFDANPTTTPKAKTISEQARNYEELEKLAEEAYAGRNFDQSLDYWNQAVLLAESFPAKDARLCRALDRVGEILCASERFGQAEMVWGRSLQLKISILGSNHPAVAYTGNHLAGLHYLLGRYSEAEAYAKKCLQVYKIAHGTNHPSVALCLHNLASLYHVQGRYAEAEQSYKSSLSIRKKLLGADHPDTISVTKAYADLLKILGRDREAQELNSNANGFITGSWKTVKVPTHETLTTGNGRCLHCGTSFVEGGCPACIQVAKKR
ncbi:MAG: tetratricopeptide repeat protein [Candidatus Obscuribacter sp.]|nr:tetratricopeptide repeat protein [Candidatus Obscuribacter sp.]